jgi:hypothetical protein
MIAITIGASMLLFPALTKQASDPLQDSKARTVTAIDCAQKQFRILSVDTRNGQLVMTVQNTGQKAFVSPLLYANIPEGQQLVDYTLQGNLEPGAVFQIINTSFPYAFADKLFLVSSSCPNVKTEKDLGRLPPQLIGWWKFDEGSGTTTSDESGNGIIGTLQNGAGWSSSCRTGNCINSPSDATINLVPYTLISGLDGNKSKTIESWVYQTNRSYNGLIVATTNTDHPPSGSGFSFYINTLGRPVLLLQQYHVDPTQNKQSVTSTGTVPFNAWAHVAVTYDGQTKVAKFYINGNLTNSATFTHQAAMTHASGPYVRFLGEDPSDSEFRLIGRLDETKIYGRVLTDQEIKALSEGFRPL